MGSAPIQLAWGDDLLLIEEAVAAMGARMAAEDTMGGGAPEKVRLKAEGRGSGDGAEVLGERGCRPAWPQPFGKCRVTLACSSATSAGSM